MNKILIILLLFSSEIFAMKIKAKQRDDNRIQTTIMFENNMFGEVISKRKGVKVDYLTNIMAKLNDKIVYNIFLSPYLSKNPMSKFYFYNSKETGKLEIFTTYNNNVQKKKSFQIKQLIDNKKTINETLDKTKYSIQNNSKINNLNIWEETSYKKAIKKFYGSGKMIQNVITVKAHKVSENWHNMPISIKADIDLESIMVLMTNNPHSVIAIFSIPKDRIINYHIRVNAVNGHRVIVDSKNKYNYKFINTDTDIIVVGKGRDGKLYKTIKNTEFSQCLNAGGGVSDRGSFLREVYLNQDK